MRAALCAAALAASALAANAAKSSGAASATFITDVSAPTGDVRRVILESFGSCHAATSLRATWREQLVSTKRDINFGHIRQHGILDDDMSAYLDGHANMVLVFDNFDFLLANNIRPIVELSFMPAEMASNASATVFHYQGGISPPANATAWSAFISEYVGLLVQRYGINEVRNWRFEVWNEPNCGFFDVGDCCGPGCGNQAAYFALYDATARAIKAVDPLIPVGGPATAQMGWVDEFLAHVASSGAPADFVSSHLYPTDPELNSTRDSFTDYIAAAAAKAAAVGLPFVVTEFNAALGEQVLDTPYAAAMVLHTHIATQRPAMANVDTMSYWTFTDAEFEEQGIDPIPYHDKFGIASMYGVPKPAYRAFQLISDLPATGLPTATTPGGAGSIGATVGTVDVLVGTSTVGQLTTVTALLTNFDYLSNPLGAVAVNVTFTGIPAGASLAPSLSLELIDSTHAFAMPTWVAAGRPLYPTPSEIAAELAASQVLAGPLAYTTAGPGALFAIVPLEAYAVARVTLTYQTS